MTKVLSLDIHSDNIVALLCEVTGKHIEVLDEKSITAAPVFLSEDPNSEETSTTNPFLDIIRARIEAAKNLLSQENWKYDTISVISPLAPSISITLYLPFNDSKTINKIIRNQLEDRVPFELDDYFIQFASTGKQTDEGWETLVNLSPLKNVDDIFAIFHDSKIKPYTLCTVADSLVSILELMPVDNLEKVLIDKNNVAFSLAYQSASQANIAEQFNFATLDEQSSFEELCFRLKTLGAFGKVDKKYLTLNETCIEDFKKASIQVSSILLNEIHPKATAQNIYALAASIFGGETTSIKPINNFAFGQYLQNPLINTAIQGLKKLSIASLIAICLISISAFVYYQVQQKRIDIIKAELKSEIINVTNRSDVSNVDQLATENEILTEQLKTLGSPTGMNLVEILSQISRDLNKQTNAKMNKVKANSETITIEGNASSYGEIDKIERIIKKKKGNYCKVTSRSTGTGNNPSFVVEIKLCQ